MITAALAVMMAMTGIAAAGISINPYPEAGLPDGGSVAIKVTWTEIPDTNLTWYLNNSDGTTPAIKIKGTDDRGVGINTNVGGPISIVSSTDKDFIVTIDDVSAVIGDKFLLKVCGPFPPGGGAPDCAATSLTTGITVIPEFATVAIPIAAVLGLVFIFQQRKNKKE